MIQLHVPEGPPALADVARMLGLNPDEIDREFGIIATDPGRGLYAVRVTTEAAARASAALKARPAHEGEGIFSDPRIAPSRSPKG